MRSGAQNAFVRFEQKGSTRNAMTNEKLVSWSLFRGVWVLLYPERAKSDKESGAQIDASVIYIARGDFHALDGVTAQMRAVYSPSGNYSLASDWLYFEVERVLPDIIDRRESTVRLRLTNETTVGSV